MGAMAAADIAALPRADRAELVRIMREMDRRKAQRGFYALFPDEQTVWDGPSTPVFISGEVIYPRHLYPKHLEFFDAGRTYRERCFMAANRCITPWTWLETDQTERPALEVLTSEGVRVRSWAGEAECTAPIVRGILKGIEPAFRLVLDNHQFFDCSRKHRVLTVEGWLSLDQLVSRADGLHSWRKREDYQASCVADGYLCDQPLLRAAGIDLAPPRLTDGAQKHDQLAFSLEDAEARISPHIRACLQHDRLSTLGDLHRFAALFSRFAAAACRSPVLPLSESTQVLLRSVVASSQALPVPASEHDPVSLECSSGAWNECRGAGDTTRQRWQQHPGAAQYQHAARRPHSIQELTNDSHYMGIFYPSAHPSLVGGRRIVAIVPLGYQPIIDAHVPGTNNYRAAGVYHHNSGKTVSGGYEIACHLTGLYPDWWTGRRFDRPTKCWAAGKTNETTRDILQAKLCGPIRHLGQRKGLSGTGIIPGDRLDVPAWKQGVADLVDTVRVRHVSGDWSELGFKSYQQGRGSFEGTERDAVWLDEEPPLEVYGECLIRTATTGGIIIITFTPLEGLSEVVLSFLPADQRPAELEQKADDYSHENFGTPEESDT